MRKRMRCFWHHEKTASLVQRKADWYCYGSCNRAFSKEEVEKKAGQVFEYDETFDDQREDLTERFLYIRSLTLAPVRGLVLPADERGFFIVWDRGEYYKYRLFEPGNGPKYIGPKGHVPPFFWAKRQGTTLYLVEGELNALSLSKAFPEAAVGSPGSASMFNATNLSKYLTMFKEYSNVIIVVDQDSAGTKALIESKAYLLYKVPFVGFIQMQRDCNEILCEKGPQGLREEVSRINPR